MSDHTHSDVGPKDDWITANGIRVVSATADAVEIEWTVGRQHLQPFGVVHGDVHCGVLETVCSYGAALAAKARGHTGGVVGLENHTNFIRAARLGAVLRRTVVSKVLDPYLAKRANAKTRSRAPTSARASR